jgi:hypothetical protein
LPRAREIWRTISVNSLDSVPEPLRPARIAFAFAKWQQAQDDDELLRAMYDVVSQSMRDGNCVDLSELDGPLLYILLLQIYLNPRVKGVRQFPKHVRAFVHALNKREDTGVVEGFFRAFFDDPQLNTVDDQIRRMMEDLQFTSRWNVVGMREVP